MLGWEYVGPFDDLPAQNHEYGYPGGSREGHQAERQVAREDRGAVAPGHLRRQGRDRDGRHRHRPHRAGVRRDRLRSGARRTACRRSRRSATTASFSRASARSTGKNAADPATADAVFEELKKKDALFATERYVHRYPHCWRCKTELLYRLVDEWFINMGPKHTEEGFRGEIMKVVKQVTFLPESINGQARELDWLAEHGRLDDLEEALLGAGAADLGERRGPDRLRGDRQPRGVEGAGRRGLGGVRRAHAAPAVDRQGEDPEPEDRQPDVAHPGRGQPVARRGHRGVLHDEVQHGPRVLEEVVPGRLHHRELPRPVPQLVLRAAGDEHDDERRQAAVQDAARPRHWCATSTATRCTRARGTRSSSSPRPTRAARSRTRRGRRSRSTPSART